MRKEDKALIIEHIKDVLAPVGRAVMGRKAGDRVYVDMGGGKGYYLQIRAIEKGTDNGDIPIGSF